MPPEGAILRKPWSEDDTILALYLYFQLPFGKLHSGNPEIQKLAVALGRTNSSVAMKLVNFASLDPKIIESGRRGLSGATKQDREIYARFAQDWSGLVYAAELLWQSNVGEVRGEASEEKLRDIQSEFRFNPYQGESETQAIVAQRVGQGFFRRAVLANYAEGCCITGIAEPQLLMASHIRPWGMDAENRHNPANGILLSATFDKAFDRGLISISRERRVMVSRQLRENDSTETRAYFDRYQDASIRPALRFDPGPAFLDWHNRHCFVDGTEL